MCASKSTPFLLSLLLLFGYLLIERNILFSLPVWKAVSHDDFSYKWEVMREAYQYSATKIFDKGYVREDGLEVQRRVLTYPGGDSLKDGFLILPKDTLEGIVKFSLPKGFQDGTLWLKATTKSKFTIGVSDDLEAWQLKEYPGFLNQITYYTVNLKKGNFINDLVYLKFTSFNNENLSVYFDILEYTSNLVYDENEYYNLLFPPETDIDFEGKEIIRQGLIYVKKKPNPNN